MPAAAQALGDGLRGQVDGEFRLAGRAPAADAGEPLQREVERGLAAAHHLGGGQRPRRQVDAEALDEDAALRRRLRLAATAGCAACLPFVGDSAGGRGSCRAAGRGRLRPDRGVRARRRGGSLALAAGGNAPPAPRWSDTGTAGPASARCPPARRARRPRPSGSTRRPGRRSCRGRRSTRRPARSTRPPRASSRAACAAAPGASTPSPAARSSPGRRGRSCR